MDVATLGAAIAVAKKLPDTAVGRAEAAAVRAEEAAEQAKERNYGIRVVDHVLVIDSEVTG